MRVVGCVELLAADLFRNAEQTRARITFGDVKRYLAQWASHSPDCDCGRCALVSQVSAQRAGSVGCVKPGCVHCVDSIAVTVVRRSTGSRDRRRTSSISAHPITPAGS